MKILIILTFGFLFLGMSKNAPSEIAIGKMAPDFELEGTKLSDFKGKLVVLEWYNSGCPFVRKHYDSGNMQKLQKKYVNKNVQWIKIVSSAPGNQGFLKNEDEVKAKEREEGSFAHSLLRDVDGRVGKLYGAQTTPQMYIIDQKGVLVYNGAIDSIRSYDLSDIPKAENYVVSALEQLLKGENPKVAKTRPYGCSVKY